MAKLIAYTATDMSLFDIYYGRIEKYTKSQLVIGDGAHSTIYGGEFLYTYEGEVFGTLQSIDQKFGRATLWRAWDIDRDANTFSYYINADDSEGAKAYVLSGHDEFSGSSGNDVLQGYAGSDTIAGGDGDDRLEGGWGADYLVGGAGRDVLDGGAGGDWMEGGAGGDSYLVDHPGDMVVEEGGGFDRIFSVLSLRLPRLVEALTLVGSGPLTGIGNPLNNAISGGSGDDRLIGLGGGDRLSGADGDDVLLGGAGDDLLFGNAGNNSLVDGAGNDVLRGGAGMDVLRGGAGDDQLFGDWGRDVLVGGLGADVLTGGTGNDVFRFLSVAEIGNGATADTITDFVPGDRIDLRGIDADEFMPGHQTFQFIDDAAFSGVAGELRFWGGRLMGDIDGDMVVDFGLMLPGTSQVTLSDLLL